MIEFVTYDRDVGALHILDYYLHHTLRALRASGACQRFVFPPIGRYLDDEDEREGLWR